MKAIISQLFNLFGFDIYAQWRMPSLAMAEKVRQVFDLLKIETVLDVGANTGQFRDFLRFEVSFTGFIHSFEPVSALVEKLRERQLADARWLVHPFALGSETGWHPINITASNDFSSFLPPSHTISPELSSKNTIVSIENVAVHRLDEVVARELANIDLGRTYLKLDTQGFDLEVLRGATSTISRIPALQTEVSFQPLYEHMPNVWDSMRAFGDAGFAVSDFFLVSRDKNLMATEFDCLMVRRRPLACSGLPTSTTSRNPSSDQP